MEYKFADIEEKWKKFWALHKIYEVKEDKSKPKFYVLDMFPYPSGAGLHVGHPLGYVASDIYARYKRLKGFNVLHPMGWDAFGLPAEQYAIETGTHPAITTEKAIKRYREQMDKIGFSFDWSREVRTNDPKFYKWTQWIFLKLFNSWYNRENNKAESIDTLVHQFEIGNSKFEINGAKKTWKQLTESEKQNVLMGYRLAYLSYAEVNWCPALGTVLANDEVKDGKSERGGYPVERKKMRQWFLRITEYSDRLLEGLEKLDWSESMKDMQRNWIGRSEGASIKFKVQSSKIKETALEIFTTRPDTIFGATFMVIAPEHDLISELVSTEQKESVESYLAYVKSRTDVERQAEKKVTGVFTGSYAVNPFAEKEIPIWIAEYVLIGYGTGAIMGVPADDERDRKFAEKFGLCIVDIIDKSMYPGAAIEDKVGKMINSGFLNGLEVKDAIKKIMDEIENREIGKRKVNYKQRDAGFGRQRYWGEPFPIVYKDDIPFPLDGKELPLILPEVSSYKPTGDGRAPLANNKDWVEKGYETDTMPGYAGSSWYCLRYMDPNNENEFASKEKIGYWQNVDLYVGGSEHAVGHLLYARFWHKFLFDLGLVSTDEPFKKLVNQGMIQGISPRIYSCVVDFKPIRSSYNKIDFENQKVNINGTWEPYSTVGKVRVDYSITEFVGEDLRIYKRKLDTLPKKEIKMIFLGESALDTSLFAWDKDEKGDEYISVAFEVEKMSKSKYNVVNPDDVIAKYGADCFRMFEMFLGPIEQSKPWDDKGISGVSNFLKKFWRLYYPTQTLPEGGGSKPFELDESEPSSEEYKILHKTLKKVSEDIERLNFNTSVSAFMIATNELTTLNCHKRKILEPLLIALAPFAPFITEELWQALGNSGSIHRAQFPKIEEKYLAESTHNYPVSINGRVRAQVELAADIEEQVVKKQVLEMDIVKKWLEGKEPKKFIFVKGKIINVVV